MPRNGTDGAGSAGERNRQRGERNPWRLLAAGCAFVLVLAIVPRVYDPYRPDGPELIGNGRFEAGLKDPGAEDPGAVPLQIVGDVRWAPGEGVGGSGGVRLEAHDGRASLRWTIGDPQRFEFLRFAGRVRTRGVVPGDRPWQMARVLLFFVDEKGRGIWHRPHVSVLYSGDQPWRRFSGTVRVPEEAGSARAFVQIVARAGTMWADDLELRPMRERASYAPLRILLIGSFLALSLAAARRARLGHRPFGRATIAAAALIFAGVLLPGPAIQAGLERAAGAAGRAVRALAPPPAASPAPAAGSRPAAEKGKPNGGASELEKLFTRTGVLRAKKAGHVLLFALLGLFAQLAWLRGPSGGASARRGAWLAAVAALLLYATGSELLQVLTETRLAQVSDFLLDVLGLAAGLAAGMLIGRLGRRPATA